VIVAEQADGFAQLDPGGFTPTAALSPVGDAAKLWVKTAERFVGASYLWGGRTPGGFDCSGLVQVALQAAGIEYLYLQADTQDDAGPGVRLATMHRVKGLEFAHVLIVGVNGTGKTTTAAKLVRRGVDGNLSVLLAATATFRSGAQEQLRIWADRLGADFVGGQPGADPAAVAFDAATAAESRGTDLLIVDTAGRLHTQRGLMDELRKIDRVVGRIVPGAPHERLLVVDATAGQNVIHQAREFGEALPLTGIVLSKFDSSGRGGTAVAVARDFHVPVRWLGTGEREEDLEPFDADTYVEKLLG
jgi:fused signal recognition particle receptor